jgi:hypothetical protein
MANINPAVRVEMPISIQKKHKMLFEFPPAIQAGIAAGKYIQVFSLGIPQSIVRDATTGQFVGNAIGFLSNTGIPLNPLAVPLQLATSGLEMYQMHRGFQSVEKGLRTLQNTVGVLQSTTAVIGMGVATGVALSAVNLHQILKLRQEVKKLDIKIENGFGDLFKEIISLPEQIKFDRHRTILIQAYGRFAGAMDRLHSAISIQDEAHRITELVSIRQTLSDARSDYRNIDLLNEVSAPGRLRRLECAWAIEQAMISTYQVAGEWLAVSDRLTNLEQTIRTDAVTIIELCNNGEEFNFIAPEISRVRYHDLEVLELWKNQNDWLRFLSSHEREDLQNANYLTNTNTHQYDLDREEVAEPPEFIEERRLQQSAYPGSIKDRLLFMMNLDRRRSAESYIHERSIIEGYKNLNSNNLQHATEFAVANFYWYFKDKDVTQTN